MLLEEMATTPRAISTGGWKLKPVQVWAAIGTVFVVLGSISWTRWLLGGHAHPVRTGRDQVPDFMLISIRLGELLLVVGAILTLYFIVYKGWRRERQLTLDAIFVIAFFSVWAVQDPWMNFSAPMFSYNSAVTNLGCPQCWVPGWSSHAQTFAEPLAWGLLYIAFVPFFILFAKAAQWCRRKWDSPWKAYGALILGAFAFEFITDTWCLVTGFYQYGGAHRATTLFYGHRYQMPLVSDYVAAGACYLALAFFRYFRNDRGQTFVERGIDDVKTSHRGRQTLRLLAVIGVCQVAVLGYNMCMDYEALHPSTWPKDIVTRPYFTQSICGPGTTYACPNSALPVNRDGAARVSPDMQLVPGNGGLPAPESASNH